MVEQTRIPGRLYSRSFARKKLRTRVVIRSVDRLLDGLDPEQRLMAERLMRELSDFRSRSRSSYRPPMIDDGMIGPDPSRWS